MPLIKDGAEIEDMWAFVEGEEPVPTTGCVSVSLTRLIDEGDSLLARNTQIGVRLEPGDDPHDLEPHLDRIALIEISFPKYTDGRGYSQAQLLRRRLGYTGELRAVGHVLRDQILYMNRSGFDAYSTARADLSGVMEALKEYSAFYQPAADGNGSVFARRHEKA
ncbi:DUF934 domain-containing protein [Hyphomonas sp. FCG-A18]|uniref:DUF934 domain-containing protein n=1 Tax=Hyphomonas sp. FCG-A18 TaxID=3080019 RepID=UPI002B2B6F27|nr:DUF934 domain-containing protein [Hyphomonas sp. FCG-A18]